MEPGPHKEGCVLYAGRLNAYWLMIVCFVTKNAFTILDCQNLEFRILAVQNPEFRLLAVRNLEFRILAVQNPEFRFLAVRNLEFRILAVVNSNLSHNSTEITLLIVNLSLK